MSTSTTEIIIAKKALTNHYLKLRVFLASKKKSIIGEFQSLKHSFPEKQLTKKYFGHKVAYLKNSLNLLKSSTSYKYFQSVTFIENAKKTPIFYQASIQSLNGHCLLSEDIRLTQRDFMNIISRMKPSVKIENNSELTSWLEIPNRIRCKIQYQNCREVEIKEKEDDQEVEEDEEKEKKLEVHYQVRPLRNKKDFESFELFSKMKNLKSLQLDLRKLKFTDEELVTVLEEISQSKLPKWNISVPVEPYQINQILKLKLLGEIDFLGFQYEQSIIRLYTDATTCAAGYKYTTPPLDKLRNLTSKRDKVLDIYVTSKKHDTEVDLFGILDKCTSLKGLFIKILGDPILGSKDALQKDYSEESNYWTKNLRDAVFCWNLIEEDKGEYYNKLNEIFKKDCPKLKTFELFSCFTFKVVNDLDHVRINSLMIRLFPKDLGECALEELTLSTDLWNFDKTKMFEKLKKLQKLTVNIILFDKLSAWDKYFPFEALKEIKELTIIIHPDTKSKQWGSTLADSLSSFENLEALTIRDESKGVMSFKTFDSFVKNFVLLKKIKTVTVKARIASLLALNKGYSQDELEIWIQEKQEELMQRLKRILDCYVRENKQLRSIDIGRLQGFNYKRIQY